MHEFIVLKNLENHFSKLQNSLFKIECSTFLTLNNELGMLNVEVLEIKLIICS